MSDGCPENSKINFGWAVVSERGTESVARRPRRSGGEARRAGSVRAAGYAHITARDLVAESGTDLASIGYHFGSKEALLNAAVIDSFDDWDDEIERAMDAQPGDAPPDRLAAFLNGVIRGVAANRAVAVAGVHAFTQFEYAPELREQLALTYRRARREVAALVLEREDIDDVDDDDDTARQLGSLALAVVNGVVLQWLIDPDTAPSAADLAAALRTLAQPDAAGGGGRSRVDAR